MLRPCALPETRGRLSWKRPARPPLWHANCFRECRQARRKLNRDPAAITSLSVACRYASRPPSVPTTSPAFQEPGRPAGFSRFWDKFFPNPKSPLFFLNLWLSTRGDKLSTADPRPVSRRPQATTRPRHRDKNCHPCGDVLRRFAPPPPTFCRSALPISEIFFHPFYIYLTEP
jgi:hypothetical protein